MIGSEEAIRGRLKAAEGRERKETMRLRFPVAVLAVFFLVTAAAGGTEPGKKPARFRTDPAPPAAPVKPAGGERGFEAWAVAEAEGGRLLAGENLTRRWPQASLTKVMLALVVLDAVDRGEIRLAEPVRVSRRAQGMGGSQVFLRAGEVFPLEELLRAALVESANDAAMAIAEHVAGSAEAFVTRMNRKARELGMEDTEYHGVHGLPPPPGAADNLSTCADLIRLARAAIARPRILEWTGLAEAPFRGGALQMRNKNRLIGRIPGVDGLKTGYTRRAGFNLIATGAEGGRRLIVVVLGAADPRRRDAFAAAKFHEFLDLEAKEPPAVDRPASGG